MNIEKIIELLITPIVLLILGIWAKGIAANHEKRISLNENIIEKRVEIYESIGQDLNDIYVFINQIGHWKELSPSEIIGKKRAADKIMHVNRPYWSDSTFQMYDQFMASCFEIWTGVGQDAKIISYSSQFKSLENWNEEWASYFSDKEPDLDKVEKTYKELLIHFSEQFGFM